MRHVVEVMGWLVWKLLVMTANWVPVTAVYVPYVVRMPAR